MDWSQEFSLVPELSYLNHAAVAPWPRRAAEAVERFARQNRDVGALNYPHWNKVEAELRGRLARLLGAASADDIALLKNTSEGLSLVAHGLDWEPGDNVVISDEEFPSNRIVWESLQPKGVEIRRISLAGGDPEGALLEATDPRTRLLSISVVQYASGLRLDLERLGVGCRGRGILFCVDAIQGLGAIPMDVESCRIDFLAADGHKWLLGPEGLAVFWCRPELRERLRLHQFGWHMVEHCLDYDRLEWEPARSARRFECGSPNMLGIHGLNASLSLLMEVGMDAVERAIEERVDLLIDYCRRQERLEILTPLLPRRRAGIFTFRHRELAPPQVHERLKQAGVVCAVRGGGIRFSPHFYTPPAALEQALKAIPGES